MDSQFGNMGLNSAESVRVVQLLILGEPTNLNILKSCSISDSPLNKGSFKAISAKRQPNDHISISNEYIFFRRSNSGARYHNLLASRPDLSLSLGSFNYQFKFF